MLGSFPCSFTTLSAAISAAPPGGTILVEEGTTLFENVGLIAKDVTIRSGTIGCTAVSAPTAPHPRIDGMAAGRIAMVSSNVTFQQVDIVNGYLSSSGGAGLRVIGGGHVTLLDATVADNDANAVAPTPIGAGIQVDANSTLTMRGSAALFGNLNRGWGAGGIYVAPSGVAILEDNAVVGLPLFPNVSNQCCGGGILVEGALELHDDSHVTGNISRGSVGGIEVLGGTATLFDAAVINGNSALGTTTSGRAGGIRVRMGGSLTAVGSPSVSIDSNIADDDGGGIDVVESSTVDLTDVAITTNTADGCGGGLAVDDSFVSMFGVVIEDNGATCGGGLNQIDGSLDTTNLYILGNSATTDGGGARFAGSGVGVTGWDVRVEGNDAGGLGGGVAAVDGATLDINYLDLIGNTATDGAGAYLNDATLDATYAMIDTNIASGLGGGFAALNGTALVLSYLDLLTNGAGTDGGGAYVGGASTIVSASLGSVRSNFAGRGGGLFVDSGDLTVEAVDLTTNTATTEGGALRQRGGTVLFSGGTLVGNVAGTMGGAVSATGGTTGLDVVDLIDNSAGTDGGAVAIAKQGNVSASQPWLHDNAATGRGGAIAVLSSGPGTNPLLDVRGDLQEDCPSRRLAANEYCSELRGNTATGGGGGIFMEDGTALVINTAFLENDTAAQGSAIGLIAHPSNGAPAMTAWNVLSVHNGTSAGIDVVRIQDGLFLGEHVTSADNVGVPFRFGVGATGSQIRRSILWDTALVQIDPAMTVDAVCTMFRAAPIGGATTGSSQDFGLDPFFVTDPIRGDYQLDATISIHAVNRCLAGLPNDLDGKPRTWRYDRGALEAP